MAAPRGVQTANHRLQFAHVQGTGKPGEIAHRKPGFVELKLIAEVLRPREALKATAGRRTQEAMRLPYRLRVE
jgi:hypothetical protein